MQMDWDASRYAREAGFVSQKGANLIEWLSPQPGESILDLGCGEGALAESIAARGAAVIGVDGSEAMVRAAHERGLDARVMAGERMDFEGEFDAVFSNAALHWMPDANRVVRGVYRALRPGGRFVAEMGGAGNIASLLDAMASVFADHPEFGTFEHPWYFPQSEEYRRILEEAGFRVEAIELFERPTPIEAGVRAWMEIFASSVVAHLDDQQRTVFLDETERRLRPTFDAVDEGWVADYVRLRFCARR